MLTSIRDHYFGTFVHVTLQKQIEKIQKQCLRILLDDNKATMMHYQRKVATLRFEMFKTINNINSKFIKNVLDLKVTLK